MNKYFFCLIAVIVLFMVAPNPFLQASFFSFHYFTPEPAPKPLDDEPEEVGADDTRPVEELLKLIAANKTYTTISNPRAQAGIDIGSFIGGEVVTIGIAELKAGIAEYQRPFLATLQEAKRIVAAVSTAPTTTHTGSASRILTERQARNPLLTLAVRVMWRFMHKDSPLPDRMGMHDILHISQGPLAPALTLNFEALPASPRRGTIIQTIIDLVTTLIDSDETLPTTLVIAGLKNYTNPTVASLRLTVLDLHGNYLVTAKRIITPMLHTLDIHDNYLTNFDQLSYARLERLFARSNQLSSITGLDAPLLKVLDVRENSPITKKEIAAFEKIRPTWLANFFHNSEEGYRFLFS